MAKISQPYCACRRGQWPQQAVAHATSVGPDVGQTPGRLNVPWSVCPSSAWLVIGTLVLSDRGRPCRGGRSNCAPGPPRMLCGDRSSSQSPAVAFALLSWMPIAASVAASQSKAAEALAIGLLLCGRRCGAGSTWVAAILWRRRGVPTLSVLPSGAVGGGSARPVWWAAGRDREVAQLSTICTAAECSSWPARAFASSPNHPCLPHSSILNMTCWTCRCFICYAFCQPSPASVRHSFL